MPRILRAAMLAAASTLMLATSAAIAQPPVAGTAGEIAALKHEIAELRKSAYHPELGEQMLTLQIRHARLWFAGEAGNWLLSAFELQELKEAFDAVVEQNPEHATFQPERLADVLPAMTKAPIIALRDAIDRGDKSRFEHAFDELSAACSACHRAAGMDFLVIQRPTTPLLDNLRAAPAAASVKAGQGSKD